MDNNKSESFHQLKEPFDSTVSKDSKDSSGNNTDSSGNNTEISNIFYTIFNKSNVILLIGFLAVYFILYLILGIFKKDSSSNSSLFLSRSFDFIILLFLVIFIYFTYYSQSSTDTNTTIENSASSFSDYLNDPKSIFSLSLFIFVFYILIYILSVPMTYDTKLVFISLTESIAWITFSILLIVDFFKYVLGIPIIDDISAWFSNRGNALPTDSSNNVISDSSSNVVPAPIDTGHQNEVFNVSNNLYTYDDAQSVCSAYGANLANYDQIETAYEQGGEWCNYGWSEGQMIFFPTQKNTWDKLQKNEKTKNNCGRPGINGGYIANPYVKFGVNCYGKKPKPSDKDLARMKAQSIAPTTDVDIALNKKVNFWKENADKMLNVNSFNRTDWSEY